MITNVNNKIYYGIWIRARNATYNPMDYVVLAPTRNVVWRFTKNHTHDLLYEGLYHQIKEIVDEK